MSDTGGLASAVSFPAATLTFWQFAAAAEAHARSFVKWYS